MLPLCFLLGSMVFQSPSTPVTTLSLLKEMADRNSPCEFPSPEYQAFEATSYNRASVRPGAPGWFADGDGSGFIRTEDSGGKNEWVLMEHEGPGCITKLWTRFFYYDFDNRVGPNVRVYLDGAKTPVIDEPLIQLVSGKGSIQPPFAFFTARAGDSYFPIPFAKSCKVTTTEKPFYYSINYRAYAQGTVVESFTSSTVKDLAGPERDLGDVLTGKTTLAGGQTQNSATKVSQGNPWRIGLGNGQESRCLSEFAINLPDVSKDPSILRSTIISILFDGEETVWAPIGDFFSSPDSLHPFQTFDRTVGKDGAMTCRWRMPFRRNGEIRITNLSRNPVVVAIRWSTQPYKWTRRTMHFHASWRPDDIVSGSPFQDWNFVDINGQGMYVGDSWTVLNMQKNSWWGEGDEKIYVDSATENGFPTQFGTGSEDYYGWAGGVLPDRKDEFSSPFLANVRVGGLDTHTLGFNINTRTRALDAIPFYNKLRFDMEASFGTDIRNPWNLLGYSAVTFWYAKPGATSNRPQLPNRAAMPIMSLEELGKRSEMIRRVGGL